MEGKLKGYFLAPDGTLKVREVPFSFPEKPSSSELPDRLFPLWAGYYLQAEFSSSKPIQSLWLLSGTGRLLWRRHYPEEVNEGTIPYQDDGWVGLKGQDGLCVKLLVRFVDGKEVLIRPNFPVRFERILPLKVDWLDFVRIAEVANLLKAKGKEIWEGFSLEGIPFLLEGDEGQWVLINHPKPPKGFVRYEGPLPKVPFEMTIYVGERMASDVRREEIGGWVEKVNGVWTAGLRYFPNWWVLSDCVPKGYTVTREPDAAYRLETIIHEAFHVWWFQRVKEPKTEGREKKAQAIVAESAERECLARALEAKEPKEKQQWIKAFLMQRERRRRLESANRAEVIFERWQEVVEGVATFVTWRAMQSGQAKGYHPILEEVDPDFFGYQASEAVTPETVREAGRPLEHPHTLGLAQILLLSERIKNWQKEVMKGKSLEELLYQVVQGVSVSPTILSKVEWLSGERFKEVLERTRGKVTEAKPPEPHVTIWIYLPDEVVHLVQRLKESLGNPLIGLNFPLPEVSIRIAPPVWVLPEPMKKRVGVLWDIKKQLLVFHYPDGTVTLQGKGLEVQGKLQVSWDINGVHVRPVEKQQKTKRSALTMMGKKAWYAVVLPVSLLAAIASRDTKALQEQEIITMEGTITGVFLNAVTNQFEKVTIPVPSSAEDYYFCDEEEYILRATFTPSWDPTNPTTVETIFVASATYYSPPGQLTVKVFLIEENESDPLKPRVDPFQYVTVEAYLKGKFKAKVETDSNGEALFPELAPGEYQLRGYKPTTNIPVCPKVTEEVTVVKNQRNITSMYFYLHKGIRGKVRVETPWMPANVSKVANVCLAREAKNNKFADFTITNPDGSVTRYKKIAEAEANQEMNRGDNWVEAKFYLPYPQPEKPDGQAYELFAFISGEFPIPSNYRWEPRFGWQYVFIPPCRRGEGGECGQAVSKDVGLVVTFRPVEGGDEGIEVPSLQRR